jgi:hypothetical protein
VSAKAETLRGRALERVARLEADYRTIKVQRIEAWHTAHTLGATQRQIAEAAGVSRGTVHDQLWIREAG